MDQEKLAELIKIIMADKRIMDIIRNSIKETGDLTLIESKASFECLPAEWKGKVFCQELQKGGDGLLNYDMAVNGQWDRIRVYRPSLNLIAKLALGIADEPLLKILQEKLIEGSEQIELVRPSGLTDVKSEAYRNLFLDYAERIRRFGIKFEERGFSSDNGFVSARCSGHTAGSDRTGSSACSTEANIWQYKALTERDLLDVEKGTALTVGKKCIVTSLAADMARRKAIRICREGEGV